MWHEVIRLPETGVELETYLTDNRAVEPGRRKPGAPMRAAVSSAERSPVTFSATATGGRSGISRITRIHWRNSPLRVPASPSALPASERSWQGNEPHERSAGGTSSPRTSSTDPRKNGMPERLAAKTRYLSSLMSFAQTVLNHGERAKETRPLPAKKSKTVFCMLRSSTPSRGGRRAVENRGRAFSLVPYPPRGA